MSSSVHARAVRTVAAGAGVAWVLLTGLSQHPSRSFDWARRYDPAGVLIPNWRFFAPNPATHDSRLAHRILWGDGETSEWFETHEIKDRMVRDPFWCPHRRRDKAVTDMTSNLLTHLSDRRYAQIENAPCYRAMVSIIRHLVQLHPDVTRRGVHGFQFLVARDTGYDSEGELELLFASRFEPWQVEVGQFAAGEPV